MWSDVNVNNYLDTVRLLSLIDIVASYNFIKLSKDETFIGWTSKRYFNSATGNGVLIAYVRNNSSHVYISFDSDMPDSAESGIIELLEAISSARIWCRAENQALIDRVTETKRAKPSYWSREMSVTKGHFLEWNKPVVPTGFTLKGYNSSDHESYISLLEETMSHITARGCPTLRRICRS